MEPDAHGRTPSLDTPNRCPLGQPPLLFPHHWSEGVGQARCGRPWTNASSSPEVPSLGAGSKCLASLSLSFPIYKASNSQASWKHQLTDWKVPSTGLGTY